ncbi:uncharacterized protein LOC125884064 isoform X1 [Epinephelus fuscoguttatus]|uniref:uncharacterized protein LOC125884064 isoform X1 n=1 Tax=Epinephelus fuscoguttatus TaxID=293821 RepID=UPI0020D0DCBD|nr:uncharacterized protein LOC125884064 isoform X1 [Epinephelus fuscoguttatus]
MEPPGSANRADGDFQELEPDEELLCSVSDITEHLGRNITVVLETALSEIRKMVSIRIRVLKMELREKSEEIEVLKARLETVQRDGRDPFPGVPTMEPSADAGFKKHDFSSGNKHNSIDPRRAKAVMPGVKKEVIAEDAVCHYLMKDKNSRGYPEMDGDQSSQVSGGRKPRQDQDLHSLSLQPNSVMAVDSKSTTDDLFSVLPSGNKRMYVYELVVPVEYSSDLKVMKETESEGTPTGEDGGEDELPRREGGGLEQAQAPHIQPSEFSMEPQSSPGEGGSPLDGSTDRPVAGQQFPVRTYICSLCGTFCPDTLFLEEHVRMIHPDSAGAPGHMGEVFLQSSKSSANDITFLVLPHMPPQTNHVDCASLKGPRGIKRKRTIGPNTQGNSSDLLEQIASPNTSSNCHTPTATPAPSTPKIFKEICSILHLSSGGKKKRIKVTVDELGRRVGSPEYMSFSSIATYLRTDNNARKELQAQLEDAGIKPTQVTAKVSLFSRLCEEEVDALCESLAGLVRDHLPFEGLHVIQEADNEMVTLGSLSEFRSHLRRAVAAIMERVEAVDLASHGFMSKMLDIALSIFEKCLDNQSNSPVQTVFPSTSTQQQPAPIKSSTFSTQHTPTATPAPSTPKIFKEIYSILPLSSGGKKKRIKVTVDELGRRVGPPEYMSFSSIATYLRTDNNARKELQAQLEDAGIKPTQVTAKVSLFSRLCEEEVDALCESLAVLVRDHLPFEGLHVIPEADNEMVTLRSLSEFRSHLRRATAAIKGRIEAVDLASHGFMSKMLDIMLSIFEKCLDNQSSTY